MSYTDEQIRENILWFAREMSEHRLTLIIPYCIGYYGSITGQVWEVLFTLVLEGTIKRA